MKHIIGHKNPDTDTVCSAIAYQDFLSAKGVDCKAYVLGDFNNETKFVLERFKADLPQQIDELPHNSEIILVDHNEEGHSIDNVNDLEIVEIIDHHKVKIETDRPITIQIEPLGSSCSIIAKKYFEAGTKISRKIASLMIAGIISDTLFYRSPTTTDVDKELVEKLNKFAEIENLEAFSMEMFNAKSDIKEFNTEKLIKLDYKVYTFNGIDYGLGVMETTDEAFGLERKEEILEKLAEIETKDQLGGVFLTIINILKGESYTLCSGKKQKELFIGLFGAKDDEDVLFVDNLLSRKKQIVPVFEKHFK